MVEAKTSVAADQMIRLYAKDVELVQDVNISIVAPAVDVAVYKSFDTNAAIIVEQKATLKETTGLQERGGRG